MVLFFKLDDKNRLWLLYCTGLKVREKVNDEKNKNIIKNQQFTTGKPLKNKKQERLLSPFLTISSNFQKKKTSNANKKLNINNGIITNLKNQDDRLCANCGSKFHFVIIVK